MGFSRQEHWSGWPCPPPGIFLTRGPNPVFCTAGGFFTAQPPGKPLFWLKASEKQAQGAEALRLIGASFSQWAVWRRGAVGTDFIRDLSSWPQGGVVVLLEAEGSHAASGFSGRQCDQSWVTCPAAPFPAPELRPPWAARRHSGAGFWSQGRGWVWADSLLCRPRAPHQASGSSSSGCLSYAAALNAGLLSIAVPATVQTQEVAELLSAVYTALGVKGINEPSVFKVKDTAFRMNPPMSCFSHKL